MVTKRKGPKDKQRSTQKIKDRATVTPPTTGAPEV